MSTVKERCEERRCSSCCKVCHTLTAQDAIAHLVLAKRSGREASHELPILECRIWIESSEKQNYSPIIHNCEHEGYVCLLQRFHNFDNDSCCLFPTNASDLLDTRI